MNAKFSIVRLHLFPSFALKDIIISVIWDIKSGNATVVWLNEMFPSNLFANNTYNQLKCKVSKNHLLLPFVKDLEFLLETLRWEPWETCMPMLNLSTSFLSCRWFVELWLKGQQISLRIEQRLKTSTEVPIEVQTLLPNSTL